MKKKLFAGILCLTVGLLSWNRVQAEDLNVVTTLPSLASITQFIGGEDINVYSITRGAQDAHYVEAKPSYMLKLHEADLLIYSGLELEIGWLPLLIQGARNDAVVVGSRGNLNASQIMEAGDILGKPRGEVDRSMGDVHRLGNPHYLLNPFNAIKVADLITGKLCDLDPEHQESFRKNRDKFVDSLTSRIRIFEKQTAHLKGEQLVSYHNHWSYLLEWIGIKAAGYIELRPGIPPTPKHKQTIISLMKEKQIGVVIISSWKEPTKAQEVAEASGVNLLILPGEVNAMEGVEDYLSWIEYLVTNLTEAFGDRPDSVRSGHQEREQKKSGVPMSDIKIFMAPAICMCVILVGICGYVGIHVIMRKVIFIDIALAQIAAFGISCGLFISLELTDASIFFVSLAFTLLAAFLLSAAQRLSHIVPKEAFIGVLYATGAAVVILAVDRLPHGSDRSMI